MNTHTLASILVVALAAIPPTAQSADKQPQQGAAASKSQTDAHPSAPNEAARRNQREQSYREYLDNEFTRAKEAERKLGKVQNKLAEMNKFSGYVDAKELKKAQGELAEAQKEFDGAMILLTIGAGYSCLAPNDEAQAAIDKLTAARKAEEDASKRRNDYVDKREAELKKAGKTKDEINTELDLRDSKLRSMDKEVQRLYEAYKKAESDFGKPYFEALKKAEQEGKYVVGKTANDKFKASSDPKSNEPPGGIKLGGNSYTPPGGTDGSDLRVIPNWDFSGTGQVTNPTVPPFIFLPPYGGSGWGGSSPMFPSFPGFMPNAPSHSPQPHGSSSGCSDKGKK